MKPDWNFLCILFININLNRFIYKMFINISDHEDTLSMKGQPWLGLKKEIACFLFFLHYFFGQKCVFYACFTLIQSWKGRKKFRVGIILNKNLLG